MKKILLLACAFILVACASSTGESSPCTVSKYRKSAQPIMQEFSQIVKELSIRDEGSRKTARIKLSSLENKAKYLDCRDEYPLKHETLIYSIKHMQDAITYADEGNLSEMNASINKSLVNVQTFNDWSVDVGK